MKQLVTAADVKRLTTVGKNADEDKLNQAVPEAQTAHLRPLLASKLLVALLDFVASAPEPPDLSQLAKAQADAATVAYNVLLDAWRTTNGGVMLTLWDAVKPCLTQWALVEAWYDLQLHIDAGGMNIKTGNGQGTSRADAELINRAYDAHRARAIGRGDELMQWLDSKKADYQAYTSISPLPTGRQPIDDFGGISLG
jgi:hypothetical protein